ncbi:MAG: sensor histidine kinase [Planctomycetota bacterium]
MGIDKPKTMSDTRRPESPESIWKSAASLYEQVLSVLLDGFRAVDTTRGGTVRGYFESASPSITEALVDIEEALNIDCVHLFLRDTHDPTRFLVSTSSAKATIFRRERLSTDSVFLKELAEDKDGEELELFGFDSADRLWALLWETMAIGPYARPWSLVGFPLTTQPVNEPIGFIMFVGPRGWYSTNVADYDVFFSLLIPLFAMTADVIRMTSRLATLYDWTSPALTGELVSASRLHGVLTPLQRLELKLTVGADAIEGSAPRREIFRGFEQMRSEIYEVKRCVCNFLDTRQMSQATQEESCITSAEARRVVGQVTGDLHELATRRGKEFAVRFADCPPLRIDTTSFESIMLNLVHNAVKYGDKATKVKVSAEKRGDKAVIDVTSYGFSISEAERERIFEPGYRTAEASRIEYTAAGLGLFTARHAAERCGGNLYLGHSELVTGHIRHASGRYRNTFRLELPCKG